MDSRQIHWLKLDSFNLDDELIATLYFLDVQFQIIVRHWNQERSQACLSWSADNDVFFRNQWQITVTSCSSSELTTLPNGADTGDSVGWLRPLKQGYLSESFEVDSNFKVWKVFYFWKNDNWKPSMHVGHIDTISSQFLIIWRLQVLCIFKFPQCLLSLPCPTLSSSYSRREVRRHGCSIS